MKIFLICPVRGVSETELTAIQSYVNSLESQGKEVYWPFRDTNQNDPVGNQICVANRDAIRRCDEVHVWWNSSSSGSLFDLGMAWAYGKIVRLANTVLPTNGKSFGNFLLWLGGQ